MVFRQYRFDSPLPPKEFLQTLGALVTQQFAIGLIHRGDLYGKVNEDGFDLRTPSSGRGNVIWVVGRLDLTALSTSGTLRILVDPTQSVAFVMAAVVVIGIQFFLSPVWLRIAVPAFFLVLTVALLLMGRAEWRIIGGRLRNELRVTLSGL
jgi:hypothetical protein